jgi:hypothetical protein
MIFQRLILILLFGIVAFFHTTSHAQTSFKVSSPEDVAIAFFKTGNTVPDFTLWAKGTPEFQHTAPALVPEYLEKEKQRLQQVWAGYNAAEDFLTVAGYVTVSLRAMQDPKDKKKEAYSMRIRFEAGDLTYFPYSFQKYEIAVIPQKLETNLSPSLMKEQYQMILDKFGKAEGNARLYLVLRPVKAYMNQPYELDGREQWMMLCDIVSLSLVGNDESPLWNYAADWYVSPRTQELRELYKKPPTVPFAE